MKTWGTAALRTSAAVLFSLSAARVARVVFAPARVSELRPQVLGRAALFEF